MEKTKSYDFDVLIGAVFDGIDWGTERVFQQQCAKAKEQDINLKILNTKLSDVVSTGYMYSYGQHCLMREKYSRLKEILYNFLTYSTLDLLTLIPSWKNLKQD